MKYISLLRGINVSGKNKILMKDLQALYEEQGFINVVTYIQSGNVVFESNIEGIDLIKKSIETAIHDKCRLEVSVQIRTHSQFKKIVDQFPFPGVDLDENGSKVLVSFLCDKPAKKDKEKLYKFVIDPEKLVIQGKEVYLFCPNGYGKTKLSNTFLEKKLSVSATTRNWKTINKLLDLSESN